MVEEAFEERAGLKRVYIGKKVLRILRKLKNPIKTSHTGRYYKLTGFQKFELPVANNYKLPVEDIRKALEDMTKNWF